MKKGRKESRFAQILVNLMVIGGGVTIVGLIVPAWRPLAFDFSVYYSLAIIATGFGLVLYAAWRIVTFPARDRQRQLLKEEAANEK